ncbi:hypothetical protein [Streptomyces parvulus]|uniref:hypothetical protein n=1 Tax=Streptomyces parvulus TaxID=146923 RepID=UPI00369EDAB7
MSFRYWCGECPHRTPWLREAEAWRRHSAHYTAEHPRITPGGRIETGDRAPEGGSACLLVLIVLALLLVLPAACRW